MSGLLIGVASLVEHRLQGEGLSSCISQTLGHRLRSCGARAQLPRGMRDLPGPGVEPVSPALAGGFFTTELPGKLMWALNTKSNWSLCSYSLIYSKHELKK